MEIKLKKYDAYKNSGVEWLGEIPESWELTKFKSLLTVHGRIGFRGYTVNDLVGEGEGAITISPSNMGDFEMVWNNVSYLSWKKYYESPEIIVEEGDLLIVKTASIGKVAYVKQLIQKATINPQILILKNVKINKSFLFYQLNSFVIQNQLNFEKIGSTIYTISESKILNFKAIVPPSNEQTAISKFLDDKTAKIDQAISIKQKQINLLKERRQILIHKAVTQGINPNVKLKDSGVAWIGAIPEHWEVKALKHIARLQSGETISAEKFVEEGYPVFGGNGFRGFASNFTNKGDFVLIGRQGALCGNVNYASGEFFASEHAIVVYPHRNENIIWLGEFIRIADFNRLSQSAAQPGIAVNVIKNEIFAYPPVEEQKEIAKFIDISNTKISTAISLKEKEIEKLKEYKASLINSVVTGKVRVL